MEGKSYSSCIKINGVPILPPMMTKDIIDEMRYYKSLAIAIEKRLTDLQTTKEVYDNRSTRIYELELKSTDERSNSICDINNVNDTATDIDASPSISTVVHVPSENTNNVIDKDTSLRNSNGDLDTNTAWSVNSDDDNKLESEAYLASSTASRSQSLSMSTDLNHSSGDTVSSKSNIAEHISESCKPQVPKTLDIVPLTLDGPESKQTTVHTIEDAERYSIEDKEDTPKLVRQGSYVLDSPGPMLLAHMQSELDKSTESSTIEYIPTSTSCATRRKEWNIAQAKVQWEQCPRGENIVAMEYGVNNNKLSRYDSCKSEPCQDKNREKNSQSPFGSHSTAKSVDCIQAMLAKEYTTKTNNKAYDRQRTPTPKYERSEKLIKSRTYDDCTSSSLAQKLGGSLGNLPTTENHIHRTGENDQYCQNIVNNGFRENTQKSAEKRQKTKLKSSITTEKLLLVYNEIQKMHKKQMSELVNRQQAEQTLLQQEFEKQQLLLLNEIKKSFPKLPIPTLAEQLTPVTPGELIPQNGATIGNGIGDIYSHEACDTPLSQNNENHAIPGQDNRTQTISCPLDHIYPASPATTESYDHIKHTQSTQTPVSESLVTNALETSDKNDTTPPQMDNAAQTMSEHKRFNVSRELFPLDSRTVHVPVLGNGVYNEKHIWAANIIIAHARGYLVRRLMQTARVIALKNTYKEALHCMLKLHVDAPLNRSEYHFLHRLQLQCDAASMNIVELFAQNPEKRMKIIEQDRELKRSRSERPTSARSYSFATQRTLARKKLKEMGDFQPPSLRTSSSRSRCQTWTSDVKEKLISPSILHTIKRSTSAGTVRKPWR